MALVIVIVILLVLVAVLGYSLAGTLTRIRRQMLDEARAWQEAHYDLSWYDPLEKTDYTVSSSDGYMLHVQLLKNPDDTNRFVIISHGYTDNRFGSLKYAGIYLEQGFNVIVYDLRGHGLNEPTYCTYSARERKDLMAIIRDSRERYGHPAVLGLHGESLGAATSVAVLEEKPPVDFVVADCGFADLLTVLKGGAKGIHVPPFMIDIASVFAKIRFGYSFNDMRPIDSLADNRIPILFIHGAEDSFILPEHSERMSRTTKGYSELRLIPGAPHAASVLTAPDLYKKYVADFIAARIAEH